MRPCVVDASAVAAAFFNEEHGERASVVLTTSRQLHAPDLIYAELASVIWKRHRRREIDQEEAEQLLGDFLRLPLRIAPSGELVEAAMQLALRTGRTVYDCLYLALAVKTKCVCVTADKRLANALQDTPLAKHVAWIGKP